MKKSLRKKLPNSFLSMKFKALASAAACLTSSALAFSLLYLFGKFRKLLHIN